MPSLPVAVTVKRGLVRAAAGRQTRTVHDWSDRFTSKRDELAAHFNRSLGEDADGKPIRVDRKRKTVSTSVGDLPISPIMDPDFKEARRRYNQPKPKPQKTTAPNSGVKERLRKKLLQNPYGEYHNID
ncbi:hypothetical protein C8035_v010896 [Colletotrichum spinosum]|uniref:Uncharacterized protein n=2 Tax=Colletotrichum orbiculare species complex TaxID=2707354 RepID=A0A4R8QM31_COLTR|nr:hypothetical protein C8035_v010896 [Colletotrichum spinosum]TDZ35213.1 hypothetical protein CTRI78_v011535 [Colletotrichum trifolii]